jgi:protein SCO1/2
MRTQNERRLTTGAGRWGGLLAVLAIVAPLLALGVQTAQAQPGYPSSFRAYAGERGAGGGPASSITPEVLKDISFKQRLDQRLPLDAAFTDENGSAVTLGDYFQNGRPVLLAFVYYQCPMLCTQVMNGISSALKAVPFVPGQDFDVVLVSFDPRDTPEIAREKKRAHLEYWSAGATGHAWHFLTGEEPEIRRATAAAGFTYEWDEPTSQFAHVSGVLVVTPDGRLSRYFYGIEYSPKELRMALVESGAGRIGSAIDELLLYCYHYDPEAGRYGVVVMNLLRLGGVATVVLMAGFILVMRRRDMRAPTEGRA